MNSILKYILLLIIFLVVLTITLNFAISKTNTGICNMKSENNTEYTFFVPDNATFFGTPFCERISNHDIDYGFYLNNEEVNCTIDKECLFMESDRKKFLCSDDCLWEKLGMNYEQSLEECCRFFDFIQTVETF